MQLFNDLRNRTYFVVLEAVADTQLADTIPLDRGLGTRNPPTDHTHLPTHQSVSSKGDG